MDAISSGGGGGGGGGEAGALAASGSQHPHQPAPARVRAHAALRLAAPYLAAAAVAAGVAAAAGAAPWAHWLLLGIPVVELSAALRHSLHLRSSVLGMGGFRRSRTSSAAAQMPLHAASPVPAPLQA
jgi:hypothetical protein